MCLVVAGVKGVHVRLDEAAAAAGCFWQLQAAPKISNSNMNAELQLRTQKICAYLRPIPMLFICYTMKRVLLESIIMFLVF